MTLAIVATGGTIASLPDPRTSAVRPAVAAQELVGSVPGLQRFGPIEVVEIARESGWNVTPDTMLRVAAEAGERLGADIPVVVTHGTDTIEETAFLCELLIRAQRPAVLSGAMRNAAEVGADGPRNLLNAARVASSPAARGWGALVVMNDEAHSARWCVKTDSYRPSALSSPGHGPVGGVTPERLWIDAPPPRVLIDAPGRLSAEVPIVKAYTGMSEAVIDAVLDATGARGLVVEGTGAGNVPAAAVAAMAAAVRRGVLVTIATRVPTGGVVPMYGAPGGGAALAAVGVLSAERLSAAKARLALMVALATASTPAEAAARFVAVVDGVSAPFLPSQDQPAPDGPR